MSSSAKKKSINFSEPPVKPKDEHLVPKNRSFNGVRLFLQGLYLSPYLNKLAQEKTYWNATPVGHIIVSNLLFITPASSDEYFVLFKFELPRQQTNMIDTNSTSCIDIWIVWLLSCLMLIPLLTPQCPNGFICTPLHLISQRPVI